MDNMEQMIKQHEMELTDAWCKIMELNRHKLKDCVKSQKEILELKQENKELNTSLAGAREVRKRLDYAIEKLTNENKALKEQIDNYWKVDDEIGGFVSGKFPDIASHLRECFAEKERMRNLYLQKNKENEELKEDKLDMQLKIKQLEDEVKQLQTLMTNNREEQKITKAELKKLRKSNQK